ncbi:T-cell surface glycoprotein CD4-like [Rhinoderma darwinii]|uniref:T-cell surface glycoprotein CD4-like n=1 Tax=Rhinoderma darwinii TaxID=43563 RepID=UPI003F6617CF
MNEKLCGICFTFMYFHARLSLSSSDKVLAEVGKKVSLPCDKETNGEIKWFKDKILVVTYTRYKKFFNHQAKVDANHYNVPSHKTNNLTVIDITISDSGTYTCQYEKSVIRTVELLVFQVSILPSASLLLSEHLVLALTSSSSIPGLHVSWKKDGIVKSDDPKLEENNVNLNSGGRYMCHIKMDDGNDLNIATQIKVFGFLDFPPIVYTSGKNVVTIPWIFNFNIRNKPMLSDVHVVKGSISYSALILNELSVTEGAASWPAKSLSKDASGISSDLSVQLLNPKGGKYQMEILLRIGNREKKLTREVCVANLTVSDSQSDIHMETTVPLQCNINCIDHNRKLCWHHWKAGREMCGQPGQTSFNIEVAAKNETVVTWTCSVTDGKERMVSANVTLEVKSDFLDLSNSLFWVTVGVGILILLLIVVILTLLIARNRRMRRARYRAWLLENLHQQRRCECKGFAPQRLRENN